MTPLTDLLRRVEGATGRPMSEAPRDGTYIIGHYDGGEDDVICWIPDRLCILGQTFGGGVGTYGDGWVARDADHLPVDEPDSWSPLSDESA